MHPLIAFALLALLMASPVMANETTSGVVTGAELLYVRRGPGVNYPAFATIERGERVEVERLDGVWALVRLPSGQSGYVHSTFLSFPGESRATIIVPATATPTPTHQPAASATADDQKATAQSEPTAPDSGAHAATDGAIATGQSGAAGAPTPGSDIAALHGEVQQLTAAVDNLQRRIGDSPSGADATGDHTWHSATVGVLVGLALLIGWMGGSAYGRQSERSRRSRIRF